MSDQVESTEELRRLVIAEFNRKIDKLTIEGRFREVDKLKKFKQTFLERNLEVLPNGTVKYI